MTPFGRCRCRWTDRIAAARTLLVFDRNPTERSYFWQCCVDMVGTMME